MVPGLDRGKQLVCAGQGCGSGWRYLGSGSAHSGRKSEPTLGKIGSYNIKFSLNDQNYREKSTYIDTSINKNFAYYIMKEKSDLEEFWI